MSLKNVDITAALHRLADRRIETAMKEGRFDNLEGAGKPLELEPMPADENARMTWWAIRILRKNDFTPDEIRWRKIIDGLKSDLASATTEARVTKLVHQINEFVHKINTLGTNALNTPVVGVSMEAELERVRSVRAT
ncbi:MAG TPA: DUF1992 domain-containing protein [Tepidisphaeraceae bacterium]|jgi:hypothetical protein|nr:DUF1992 domain-containing protein [Tepidisphaeraceae bacterium]